MAALVQLWTQVQGRWSDVGVVWQRAIIVAVAESAPCALLVQALGGQHVTHCPRLLPQGVRPRKEGMGKDQVRIPHLLLHTRTLFLPMRLGMRRAAKGNSSAVTAGYSPWPVASLAVHRNPRSAWADQSLMQRCTEPLPRSGPPSRLKQVSRLGTGAVVLWPQRLSGVYAGDLDTVSKLTVAL
jgi:hypothetical protein